jgi:hypothetical protein
MTLKTRVLVPTLLLTLAVPATYRAQAPAGDLTAEGTAWWAHILFLADDKLEGRNVGTPGFDQALDYVEGQFKAIGLKPAGLNGTYRQPVGLESRSLVPEQTQLALVRDGKETPLVVGQDASISARGELDGSKEAGLVFVGYGMSIPEANWDDFKGLDLKGKVAVYVNAFPPVTVSDNVKSHVNTADERWVALKKAGAIGVATIAAPRAGGAGGAANAGGGNRGRGAAPAGAGAANANAGAAAAGQGAAAGAQGAGAQGTAAQGAPAAVPGGGRGNGGGPSTGLGTGAPATVTIADRSIIDANGEVIAMSLTARGAAAVLEGTGHTLDEFTQLIADNKPLPRFAIPATLKAHAQLKREPLPSANVVGMVEGSDPSLKNEYVIMSAHLDHLGVGRAVNGDNIYNGAMDDASGIASLIETARLLKASGVKTKRSVVFLAVTAEEKGELGSQYFAAKPTVPFQQIVADLNLDMFMPLFPLTVIEVQGLAESSLGVTVAEAAKTQGVDVQTDREPEQNRFIRSDQYSFIRRGVPALAFKFGYINGSPDETTRRNWVRDIYHKPADDTKQPVDKNAAALFDRVIMTLLQRVANDTARPTWNADSFFKQFAK